MTYLGPLNVEERGAYLRIVGRVPMVPLADRPLTTMCAVVQMQRASAPRPSLKGPVGREARHTRFVGESRRRTFLQG